MPMMTKELKKKKISYKKTPLGIAQAFYKEIVQKHKKANGYDDYENFEHVNEDNVITDFIEGLIKGIISFVKNAKAKKAAGQTTTKTEDAAIKVVTEVEQKAKEAAKEKISQTIGDKLLHDPKTQMIVAAIIIVIIIVAAKFMKK
jgi:hypothetical protein